MIPLGFQPWTDDVLEERDNAILVLHVSEGSPKPWARGTARELVDRYGQSILAWRREPAMPDLPPGGEWIRFPDALPDPGQHVTARLIDTVGWRALGLTEWASGGSIRTRRPCVSMTAVIHLDPWSRDERCRGTRTRAMLPAGRPTPGARFAPRTSWPWPQREPELLPDVAYRLLRDSPHGRAGCFGAR